MPLSRVDPQRYEQQLEDKVAQTRERFAAFSMPEPSIHPSPVLGYRMRAEFRVWHDGDELDYVMFRPDEPKIPVPIREFPIASGRIQECMPRLIQALKREPLLRRKLFQVEFLSTQSQELLVTLAYHRALDEQWQALAAALTDELGLELVGRSRKQKLVLSRDYVDETLEVAGRSYHYRQYEQSFTQPNAAVNCAMIEWALEASELCSGDLLELYCGNGNFTLPLSERFPRVLATEVSKSSIRAALHNRDRNAIDNLQFVRLSAEEVTEALAGKREFRRLKQLPISLAEYDFQTVFVDPPRAGLDSLTVSLVSRFPSILYVSCNPETLAGNLQSLCDSHRVERFALFDQFPYTDHIECGVLLTRKA